MDNGARCTAGSQCPVGQGSRAIFRRWAAAFPYDELMRHDDLGGQQVGVLDVVDGLAGGFHAQLVGVEVHGGQLGAALPFVAECPLGKPGGIAL